MEDCRCRPLPQAPIPIIGAAQSDAGNRFAARYCDYNFCASYGVNEPTALRRASSGWWMPPNGLGAMSVR